MGLRAARLCPPLKWRETELGQPGHGGSGGPERGTGPPCPADTRPLSKGASFPCKLCRVSEEERFLQTGQEGGIRSCCWHRAGRAGLSALRTLWLPGNLSDIMVKIRPGFQMLALPRPAQPGQLDPPKTGSLLSAAFYRTIKPKVQVRSLRPVIKKGRLRLL